MDDATQPRAATGVSPSTASASPRPSAPISTTSSSNPGAVGAACSRSSASAAGGAIPLAPGGSRTRRPAHGERTTTFDASGAKGQRTDRYAVADSEAAGPMTGIANRISPSLWRSFVATALDAGIPLRDVEGPDKNQATPSLASLRATTGAENCSTHHLHHRYIPRPDPSASRRYLADATPAPAGSQGARRLALDLHWRGARADVRFGRWRARGSGCSAAAVAGILTERRFGAGRLGIERRR